MRLTDNRYANERNQFELALRMIRHEARTGTIRACTGFTEDRIRKSMESVMRGRTTFVIAHRLSTVHRADVILVLEDGAIVEQGTHQELLASGGLYREIYELQLRPQEEVFRELQAPVLAPTEVTR